MFFGKGSPREEHGDCEHPTNLTLCRVNYQIFAVMLLKSSDGQLLVAVDHKKLHTMASKMEFPIDWPGPHTLHRAVLPEHHLYSTNRSNRWQELNAPLSAYEAAALRMGQLRLYLKAFYCKKLYIFCKQPKKYGIKCTCLVFYMPTIL